MAFGHGALQIDVGDFPDPILDPVPAGAGRAEVVLAGGCFWCTEAVYRELEGVVEVTPGYSGGEQGEADYETVCGGTTNHAEAIRIVYEPTRVSLGRLLKIFFSVAHDPTQLDHQGNDVGRQYRSVVFYADETQKEVAQAYMRQLDDAHVFAAPIVTQLVPLSAFYAAEDYHKAYASAHPDQPYIAFVARPKVDKLRHYFAGYTKAVK
ncbi:MAG TPA: peptide-methionine (S)-S-oxide reductase MsrA [Nevskiaceae bacterium]